MAKTCPRDPHKAYYAALKADERFSRQLVRAYGKKRAGDARYKTKHTDAAVERAKKVKLRADACLRKSWGRSE